MLFKKTEDLKVGMRLARPIYNRNGILLYERNSKLTTQGIMSIHNFGLIGIYILEPAEPVPPMTADDIEFERFQTISFFTLRDEMKAVQSKQEAKKLLLLANSIINSYGGRYHKINFIQNLRSQEDYIYKHTLNVSILAALMAHQMNFTYEEQLDVVMAALLHDLHKLALPSSYADKKVSQITVGDDLLKLRHSFSDTLSALQYDSNISSSVRIMLNQLHTELLPDDIRVKDELLRGTKVLQVAEVYDTMTAMKSYTEPTSEVSAIRYLRNNHKLYDTEVVRALTNSIHILAPSVCVTLTDNERGIVITENHEDVLRPTVLCFNKNQVLDLSSKSVYNKIQILDVMKTLDNRFVIDPEAIANFKGNPVE